MNKYIELAAISCYCDHPIELHADNGRGKCLCKNSYGSPCDCDSFEEDKHTNEFIWQGRDDEDY